MTPWHQRASVWQTVSGVFLFVGGVATYLAACAPWARFYGVMICIAAVALVAVSRQLAHIEIRMNALRRMEEDR